MERIENINVQRIQWCCEFAHITTDDLAHAVGIAPSTINGLLDGSNSLTYNQLRKIANYFHRGILFFLEGAQPSENLFSTAFRTIANQKVDLDTNIKALVERAERQRGIYAALIEDLEEQPPLFSDPSVSDNPIDAATQARQWLNLSDQNDFLSYRTAIENRGILVFLTNGFQGQWQIPKSNPILGFSLYDQNLPLIVVKKADQETRQSFTLMHELAHVLIHRTSVIDDESDFTNYTGREHIANQFAAHLLIPNFLLQQIQLSEKPKDPAQFGDWLRVYRQRWGVSTEAILLRLLSVQGINRTEYESFKVWSESQSHEKPSDGVRLYRHREPRNIFGDRYVKSVLEALYQDRITINKASRFLDGLKLTDIRKLGTYCETH